MYTISTYNHTANVNETLESAQRQAYPQTEAPARHVGNCEVVSGVYRRLIITWTNQIWRTGTQRLVKLWKKVPCIIGRHTLSKNCPKSKHK